MNTGVSPPDRRRESPDGDRVRGSHGDRDSTPIGSPLPIVPHEPPTTADIAAEHAGRGWHVFPVLPGSKRPLINDWPTLACADPERVRAAWPANHNIGISCGPSQLVVVDLDVPVEPKPLPPPWDSEPGAHDGLDVWAVLRERHDPQWNQWLSTYTVATPRGGLHIYFRDDGTATRTGQWRNTTGALGPLVDTRASGGFVVGAGSVVDGKTYELLDDSDPVRPPGWLARLLTTPAAPVDNSPSTSLQPTLRRPDKYVEAAVLAEIAAVAGAWEGARNNQLNKSAFALARFVAAGQLDRDVAARALRAAAVQAGLTSTEAVTTIRSAFNARGAA
jgi:hypothetical protein